MLRKSDFRYDHVGDLFGCAGGSIRWSGVLLRVCRTAFHAVSHLAEGPFHLADCDSRYERLRGLLVFSDAIPVLPEGRKGLAYVPEGLKPGVSVNQKVEEAMK